MRRKKFEFFFLFFVLFCFALLSEVAGTGVTSNALWPATAVESFATKNFQMVKKYDVVFERNV
jgi:hypothetical protein